MQANRTTAKRRSPWRTALDTALGLFGASRVPASAPATSSVDETAAVFIAPDATSKAPAEPKATRAPHEATLGTVDFLAQLDDTLRFQYVSDASIGFIGYHRDYLGMLTLHDLVPSTEADELNALVARAHASGKLESATLSLVKSLTYPICVELRMMSTAAQGVPGFALAAFDVSHWRDNEAKLRHALHHDPLTGLDNLTALIPALNAVQAEAEHTRTQAALVLVDIDDYQRINRALGYDAGDDLLRETARRIQHAAGHGEIVARIASDQFAVLVPAGTTAEAPAAENARPAPADARSRSPTGIADSTRICRRAWASRFIRITPARRRARPAPSTRTCCAWPITHSPRRRRRAATRSCSTCPTTTPPTPNA